VIEGRSAGGLLMGAVLKHAAGFIFTPRWLAFRSWTS